MNNNKQKIGSRKKEGTKKKLSKNLRDFYGNLSKQSCSATFQHLHMTYHHYVLRSACLRGATINFSQARPKKTRKGRTTEGEGFALIATKPR